MLLLLLRIFTILPLSFAYKISDFLAWVLRKLVRYRVDVVKEQLQNAFPNKNVAQIQKIIKKFYQSFVDQWIETIYALFWSEKQIKKHISGDLSAFDNQAQTFVFLSHQFNWELANLYASIVGNKIFAGFYLPVKNKNINNLFLKKRSRFGGLLIPADNFHKEIKKLKNQEFTLSFIADQNPGAIENAVWKEFFNQKVPFLIAPFKMARLFNAQVLFAELIKEKRGKYKIKIHKIADNAKDFEAEELLNKYVENLEKSISNQKENWMWTHKRWKYAKNN